MQPFANKDIKAYYHSLPEDMRAPLLHLRALVFDVADNTEGVGTIEETLKWNVPSYLTIRPKSGTTIRLAGNADSDQYGLYVHCQTSLISHFREIYPDTFTFEKNRAIILSIDQQPAEKELRHCIAMALMYHAKK